MPWSTSHHPGSTRQSRREREQVLVTHPTCYLRYDGCTVISTEDDHIVPLHQGGTNDLSNRAGACHHCHSIKTNREATAARPTRKRPTLKHPGLTS